MAATIPAGSPRQFTVFSLGVLRPTSRETRLRQRRAHDVALADVAAQPLQLARASACPRRLRPRRAGRSGAPRSIAERTERRSPVSVEQARHEGPVDLQLVEREAAQVRERREAGAEVVDRELHAHALQAREASPSSARRRRSSSSPAISSVTLLGVHAPGLERSGRPRAGSSRSVSDRGRQVHREARRRCLRRATDAAWRSAALSIQKVSVPMRPVRSAMPTMRVGRHVARLRMAPAHQRLGAHGRPVASSTCGW